LIEALRLSTTHAPDGFSSWLDQHVETHDPIMRSVSRARLLRDAHVDAAAGMPGHPLLTSLASHRCWNDHCMHYIYGFATQADRDNHMRSHVGTFSKRDSGLSVGSTPPMAPQRLPHTQIAPIDLTKQPVPVRLPRPAVSSGYQSLIPTAQARDRPVSSSSGYALSNQMRGVTRAAGGEAAESDIDSHLPPIKRARVGHSRLQSIGELQLLRDNDPCLRCKASHKAVCSQALFPPFVR
jgi:hypothetical protein